MKTIELVSIIGSIVTVGVTLGAIVIGSNANLHTELRTEMQELRAEVHGLRAETRTEMRELRAEVHGLRAETRTEMQGLRTELRADFRALETRLSAVEQRQARTEGLLEALRDALAAYGLAEPRGEKEARGLAEPRGETEARGKKEPHGEKEAHGLAEPHGEKEAT